MHTFCSESSFVEDLSESITQLHKYFLSSYYVYILKIILIYLSFLLRFTMAVTKN